MDSIQRIFGYYKPPCPYAAADVRGVVGCDQKELYTGVAVTPSPVQIPTQRSFVHPEFHVGCRLGRELFTLPT